jgi:Flp pilus assembly protein TadG
MPSARPILNLARAALRLARTLARERDANVMMITALAIIPTMFGLGFCIDYARAQMLQSRIAAVADAAALAATDPIYFAQTDPVAQAAAQQIFAAQITDYADFTQTSLTITITDSGSFGQGRNVDVSWSGTSLNMFSGILGMTSLAIGGDSQAQATLPPSINFYLAMDTSPSMLLPITSTGITNLIAGARWNGESSYYSGHTDGCDFACHSNNMQQWNAGVYVIDSSANQIFLTGSTTMPFYRVSCAGKVYDYQQNLLGSSGTITTSSGGSTATYCSGSSPGSNNVVLKYKPTGSSSTTSVSVSFPDTWWLAQNYATVNPGQSQILLRTDAEATAAANVITYAYNMQTSFASSAAPPKYNMQFFTFNIGSPTAVTTSPFGTMTNVSTLQSSTFPNLGAQAPLLAANTYWTSTSTYTANADTNFTTTLTGMQSILPSSAGAGTQSSPYSVLIIITDGLEDDQSDGTTALNTNNINQCSQIKAAGTRIAILYTQYLPSTINYTANTSFNNTAANIVPNIQSALQSCATKNPDGTYLMETVSTNGDISAALTELFATIVQTSHLVR